VQHGRTQMCRNINMRARKSKFGSLTRFLV
jgi:hypothetical protein